MAQLKKKKDYPYNSNKTPNLQNSSGKVQNQRRK